MCSHSDTYEEAKETRHGKAIRSAAPSPLRLWTQPVLWAALGLAWHFRDVPNWDQEAEHLYPHINQSWDVGCPRKSRWSWKRQFILGVLGEGLTYDPSSGDTFIWGTRTSVLKRGHRGATARICCRALYDLGQEQVQGHGLGQEPVQGHGVLSSTKPPYSLNLEGFLSLSLSFLTFSFLQSSGQSFCKIFKLI